jgi:hypothetical protein
MEYTDERSFVDRFGGPMGVISFGYATLLLGGGVMIYLLICVSMPLLIPDLDRQMVASVEMATMFGIGAGIPFFCLFLSGLWWPRVARIFTAIVAVLVIPLPPGGTAYAAAWGYFLYRRRKARSSPAGLAQEAY